MMGLQPPETSTGQEQTSKASSNLECDFYMYLFKIQPCPKRGAHDWSSCPYAHPKEKARRRDPRVYKYASTPCPESLQGVNCGRGADCPYAHSVYEYWLHPARFRTQMCKKGNQCNRTLCFFAHSASELRFPDTEDELEAAAVDAAAASATAGPLPLCHPAMVSSSMPTSHPGLVALQPAGGNSGGSLPLMHIGSVCSDASTATATMGTADNSSSSYSMAALQAAAGSFRQGSCASQLTGIIDDMSGSYGLGGSDPGLFVPGLAAQQQQQQQQQAAVQGGNSSLSEPLPRLGSDNNSLNSAAAWLQLATASQLPASQILSSIRPPNAASVAAQAQQQLQQRQMLQSAQLVGMQNVAQQSAQLQAMGCGALLMTGGSGSSSRPLVQPPVVFSDSSDLAASMSGLQLQAGLDDDRSGHLGVPSAATSALVDRLAALTTAVRPPMDAAMLQGSLNAGAVRMPPAGNARAQDFLLLQLLQEKQVVQQQQQQLACLGSMAGNPAMAARQGGPTGRAYADVAAVTAPPQSNVMGWGFGLGI